MCELNNVRKKSLKIRPLPHVTSGEFWVRCCKTLFSMVFKMLVTQPVNEIWSVRSYRGYLYLSVAVFFSKAHK